MSDAWKGEAVLWREPWKFTIRNLVLRTLIPGAILAIGGIPGLWSGAFDEAWLSWIALVIAFIPLLIWVLTVWNLVQLRRKRLVLRGSGAVERLRTSQERLLKRPADFTSGFVIDVVPRELSIVKLPMEPIVTLRGAQDQIEVLYLYGATVEEFIDEANRQAQGRNVTFKLGEPIVEAVPEPEPKEFDWPEESENELDGEDEQLGQDGDASR